MMSPRPSRSLRLVGLLAAVLVLGAALAGCGASRPYTLGPIKTADPDDRPYATGGYGVYDDPGALHDHHGSTGR